MIPSSGKAANQLVMSVPPLSNADARTLIPSIFSVSHCQSSLLPEALVLHITPFDYNIVGPFHCCYLILSPTLVCKGSFNFLRNGITAST